MGAVLLNSFPDQKQFEALKAFCVNYSNDSVAAGGIFIMGHHTPMLT